MSDITADAAPADTTGGIRPSADVLALTDEERWRELTRFMHVDGERFHLSGIKGSAGIAGVTTA